MKNNRRNPGEAALGGITSSKANSHRGAVSAHPGKTDRMKGARADGADGPSNPDYLPPRRRGRR